ncbi:MAG TPA: FapA family protein [bacterium]|nr:FapA family protein [bacterium]
MAAERQLFLISDLQDTDEYLEYSIGRYKYSFSLNQVFEVIEKKYYEVVPGQLLYALIPTNPENSKINAKKKIMPGKNTAITKDGTRIYSAFSGILQWRNNFINVLPLIEINSDLSVEYGTGNIIFDGSIIVLGAIDNGAIVDVTGDIYALKIFDAEIKCGGNIYVRDGIFDIHNGHIKCSGNIKTNKIIDSNNIEANGLIIVEDTIRNSKIKTESSVIVTGPGDRTIIRSEIFVCEMVMANIIGSKRETIYTLETGFDESKFKEFLEDIYSYEQLLKEIDDIKNLQKTITDEKRIEEYNKSINALETRANSIKSKIDEIYNKINFKGINEYFEKYATNTEEIELRDELKFIVKRINEKIKLIELDIKNLLEEKEKIESGMLDDKMLERLEQIESSVNSMQAKIKYFKELLNLAYLPKDKTKVVQHFEECFINIGLTVEEREDYDKLIDQKKFCLRNISNLKTENEKLQQQAENDNRAANQLKRNLETIKQIESTLSELAVKLEPYETFIKNRKFCKLSIEDEIIEGTIIKLDGKKVELNKRPERLSFVSNIENITIEGFIKIEISELFPEYHNSNEISNVKFEDLKLRRNILIEGIDNQNIYQYSTKLLNIPPTLALFIDLERYMQQTKKIIRLNTILLAKNEDKNQVRQSFFKIKNSYPIQVVGATVKECLEKAADHFKCSTEDLDYEILQYPSKSFISLKKQSYVLKVSRKGKEKKDIDGFFVILNTINGLIFTVFPPRGLGKKAKYEDVIQQLKEFGYEKDIDFNMIQREIETMSAEERKIAPRQPEPELDGKFFINISSDKMQAILTVLPPQFGGLPVAIEDIATKIKELNLTNVNFDIIQKALKNQKKKVELIICQGVEPTAGVDAQLMLPFLSEDKSEEEKKIEEIFGIVPLGNVKKSNLIAKKIPPQDGKPGRNIFDKEIPAPKDKNFKLRVDHNANLSDDENKIFALISGMAFREGYKFYVEEALRIPGDVDNHTGDIDFPGTVIISGAIKDGFKVKAGGDIYVSNIESAEVECGRNLYIRRGVAGNYKCRITVQGNIITNFIEQATIFCKRNVIVANAIMHSVINASENILVLTGGNGLIVGGIIRAGKSVFAKIIGSRTATVTTIEAGSDPENFEKLKKLDNFLVQLDKFYKSNRLNIKKLLILQKTGKFTEKHQEMLEKLKYQDREMIDRIKKILPERNKLLEIIEAGKDGKICVKERCYTGVRITISRAKIKVDKVTDFVTFFYLDMQVRIKPYEPPVEALLAELKKENIQLRTI